MRSKKINHSKYKNSSVLFELLVRQITADILEGKSQSPAVTIMKKYFNSNTELGKEIQLYHSFLNCGKLTETRAIHFIDLVLEQYKKLNIKLLAREKYDLIREIKEYYNLKDFLSSKISQYKILASIYKTLVMESVDDTTQINNIHEIATARFALIEYLITEKQKKDNPVSEYFTEFKSQPEDVRLITYRILINKFNEKYANLNAKQKALLREYINNIANTNSLVNYVKAEIPVLRSQILDCANRTSDKVRQIKLKEVAEQITKIGTKRMIKDNELTALIVAYQIVEELKGVSK